MIGKTYRPKTWRSVFIIYLPQHYNFLSLSTELVLKYVWDCVTVRPKNEKEIDCHCDREAAKFSN